MRSVPAEQLTPSTTTVASPSSSRVKVMALSSGPRRHGGAALEGLEGDGPAAGQLQLERGDGHRITGEHGTGGHLDDGVHLETRGGTGVMVTSGPRWCPRSSTSPWRPGPRNSNRRRRRRRRPSRRLRHRRRRSRRRRLRRRRNRRRCRPGPGPRVPRARGVEGRAGTAGTGRGTETAVDTGPAGSSCRYRRHRCRHRWRPVTPLAPVATGSPQLAATTTAAPTGHHQAGVGGGRRAGGHGAATHVGGATPAATTVGRSAPLKACPVDPPLQVPRDPVPPPPRRTGLPR